MTRWIFDFEATGAQRNHAHPYDHRNVACNVGFKNIDTGEVKLWKLEYDETPYGEALQEIQGLLNSTTLLIGFNAKYDLSWLTRYNLVLSDRCRVFDCQVAFFILTYQKNPYPSLDGVAEYYGVEKKLDIVKTEFWDKGLDTDEVPYDILSDYLAQDLNVTGLVFEKIQGELSRQSHEMKRLVDMSMLDLIVLQDIEKNGLLINLEKSIKKGDEIVGTISNIDTWLRRVFKADWFNPNSGDHLSVFLYGGTLLLDDKEEYTFTYKDGRTTQKLRSIKRPFVSEGLFKAPEGSELAKEGFYATNESTLTALSKSAKGEYKKILDVILQRSKIEKLRGTYYHGYPKRILEMGWKDNIIHSSFNQCVTISGRLSSNKPNVQNLAEKVKEVFVSRFLLKK